MEPVATDHAMRSDPGGEEAERPVRFSILLVCMLVGLMLAPLFGESDTGFTIARIVGVLILLAALSVVGVHRLAIVLFVPTLVVQLVAHRSNVPIVVVTSVILRALFFAYVTGAIVWHVLRKPHITVDTIAGAACAYVLLGLIWADAHGLVERGWPARSPEQGEERNGCAEPTFDQSHARAPRAGGRVTLREPRPRGTRGRQVR